MGGAPSTGPVRTITDKISRAANMARAVKCGDVGAVMSVTSSDSL
jgi:hypothetical protein